MGRFDDDKLLKVFSESGQYPKIHDNICVLVKRTSSGLKRVADIGACHGLLSHRLLTECDKEFVLAVEGNKKYLVNATKHSDLCYYNKYVLPSNLDELRRILHEHRINLVVARRVLPEICDAGEICGAGGVKLVSEFAHMLHDVGVEQVILEGRVNVPNPKNRLPTVEHEAIAISDYYAPIMTFKNCMALERRK